MEIKIIKPGVLTTIQDLGRMDALALAVPFSGAMDQLSARIANMAVGNNDKEATMEFTYGAASFSSETDILIAYAGAGATLVVEGNALPMNRPIFIPAGKTITFENDGPGLRTYLAIAGGWDVPEVLGSKSTFLAAGFGGYAGRALQKGDVLNSGIIDFLTNAFTIGIRSNRMGYHLEGSPLHRLKQAELMSTAVCPGTIQVTGEGSMILLMADCQTTGGYPRIGQVAAVDLPLCAQLKPGDLIRFTEISMQEAEHLVWEREAELASITSALEIKINSNR
ncbi:MAG: biotin-dependent carboxyltransferase family protein [Pedobacter sp.]|nr:MAG: biotin-dependent carboxyltransferase family protein [Pedobacter sp.]